MAAAAGGMMLASAVVKEATTRLGAAIGGQIKLRWNFNKDLQQMKDTLESIEAVLQDAERRSFNDEKTVQLWLKRLKDAAEDITDMVDVYEARTASNPRTPKLLSKIFRFRKLTKFNMAKKMKKMRRKLKNIADQRHDYVLKPESSPRHHQLPDKREELVEAKASYIVGKNDDKEKILSCLLHAINQKDAVLTILPIYGIGGIGKTTLAKLVFSEAKFKDYSQVWIYVPQMSDLKQIGNFIISEVSQTKSEIHSIEIVKDHLGEVLAYKKIFIVLDDMWETKPSELYNLKAMLNVGNGGKVIAIVTTRDKYIADKICTVEPYKLPLLPNEMCWTIIKQKVNFEARSDKDQLETVGREIASKCGGLALAAQTLGYLLESCRTSDE
ncbi:unnamed protein product [Urochloa humidicola]